MEKQQLLKAFNETFGKEGESVYFSPGRINLIGEHTDYNGGHVFPCAITLGTYGVYGARTDRKVRLFSENFASLGVIEFDLDHLAYRKEDQWTNYVKGMLLYLSEAYGTLAHGFDSYIYGTIPNGAGLSSSASLELLFGVMVNEEFSLHADRLALIKLGKKVENAFIGVNSGIMDQFAVGMGKKNHAILLDCDTLDYDLVPIKMDQYVIVIMNTNKRRELADSKYNERRAECDAALSLIQTKQSVSSLGQLTVEQLEKMADLFESQEVLYRRAAHAVSENQRTLLVKQALKANQLTEFGQLLNASHASLRDDYEVTGKELDTIVAYAQAQPGVLGARMTGAGFGGCAIALVEKDTVDAFIETVGQAYEKAIGYPGAFYVAEIADGTNTMKEEEDKKMTILVLGGAGYIGSHAVDQLIAQGYDVAVVDNLLTGHRAAIHPNARFYEGDIRDKVFLQSVFAKETVDGVLHFAASSLVGESVEKPLKYFDNNVYGTLVTLEVMQEFGVKRIIFSSTAATYGEPEQLPIMETTKTQPKNPYGESKLMMEKMMRWCDEAYGIRYVALRYFNVAGAKLDHSIGEDHTPETHLVPIILQTALGQRHAITIFGENYPTKDGTCIRDYVHVVDLIQAHIQAYDYLCQGGKSDVFNLGSNEGFSVKEMIAAARQVTGKEIPVLIGDQRAGDPAVLVASPEKAKRILGWQPQYTNLETILSSAWAWHQSHPEGYPKEV